MPTVATLVDVGHNRVRYLLVSDGGDANATTITTTGAATPDLVTDTLSGPLKDCANAHDNGLGQIAAGALTQAQARAIWLADAADTNQGPKQPRCEVQITRRSGTPTWIVDANVAGGEATVVITPSAAAAASCYVDIFSAGAIGH